jgi:hypothetical protein
VPTFERSRRFRREYLALSPEQRAAFKQALRLFIEALRRQPPACPPSLRVKRVQGHPGVWELTFAADGRATFAYGEEVEPGQPHVVWRRVGDHSILSDP